MDENESCGIWRIIQQSLQALPEILEITHPIMRRCFDIEYINENPDVSEYCRFLSRNIALQETILASAIPKIENESSQEALVRLFNFDGSSEPAG